MDGPHEGRTVITNLVSCRLDCTSLSVNGMHLALENNPRVYFMMLFGAKINCMESFYPRTHLGEGRMHGPWTVLVWTIWTVV